MTGSPVSASSLSKCGIRSSSRARNRSSSERRACADSLDCSMATFGERSRFRSYRYRGWPMCVNAFRPRKRTRRRRRVPMAASTARRIEGGGAPDKSSWAGRTSLRAGWPHTSLHVLRRRLKTNALVTGLKAAQEPDMPSKSVGGRKLAGGFDSASRPPPRGAISEGWQSHIRLHAGSPVGTLGDDPPPGRLSTVSTNLAPSRR